MLICSACFFPPLSIHPPIHPFPQSTTHPPTHPTHERTDQTGEEVVFKVKKTTKLGKVMTVSCSIHKRTYPGFLGTQPSTHPRQAYAARKGVNAESIRFLYDGTRVQENQTPEELDIEDDDQIDVSKVGGWAGLVGGTEKRATRRVGGCENAWETGGGSNELILFTHPPSHHLLPYTRSCLSNLGASKENRRRNGRGGGGGGGGEGGGDRVFFHMCLCIYKPYVRQPASSEAWLLL